MLQGFFSRVRAFFKLDQHFRAAVGQLIGQCVTLIVMGVSFQVASDQPFRLPQLKTYGMIVGIALLPHLAIAFISAALLRRRAANEAAYWEKIETRQLAYRQARQNLGK